MIQTNEFKLNFFMEGHEIELPSGDFIQYSIKETLHYSIYYAELFINNESGLMKDFYILFLVKMI